jgi:hypothetical protein
VLISIIKRNLNHDLNANIHATYRATTDLTTYEQWKTAAIERDRNFRDLDYVTSLSSFTLAVDDFDDDFASPSRPSSSTKPIVCHNCSQEGVSHKLRCSSNDGAKDV